MEWRPLIWAQVAHEGGIELPEDLDAERRAWVAQRQAQVQRLDLDRSRSQVPDGVNMKTAEPDRDEHVGVVSEHPDEATGPIPGEPGP